MKFHRYSSIENSYRQLELHRMQMEGKDKGKWCVQEKVHGSNFSFWVNKKEIRCAKRSGLLAPDANFYNFQRLMRHWEYPMREYFERRLKSVKELTFYGEIMGGVYPHPDVEPVSTPKIQGGIYYHPDVRFYLFDIMKDGEFISIDVMADIAEEMEMHYAKTLFSGTLYECMEYENTYQTTIPDYYDLPPIEGNMCEGNVIKPNKSVFMKSGSRVLLKNKNPKFSEISGTKTKKASKVMSPLGDNAWEVLSTYVTENRLNNVLSKMGPVTFKDFGNILGAYNIDVLEDFEKDEPEGLESFGLDKDEGKMVRKMMSNEASNIIREYLKKYT